MTMTFIASQTISSNTVSYDFTNIPQTFTHLQLRIVGRGTSAGTFNSILFQFNGDFANNNYAMHELYGDGSSVGSTNQTSTTFITQNIIGGAGNAANVYSNAIIDILDYTSTTKTKTVRFIGGVDNNGSGRVTFGSGFWYISPIVAVNRIGLYVNSWAPGSRFDLYGITTSAVTGA